MNSSWIGEKFAQGERCFYLYEVESDALDSSWNGTSHPSTDLAMYVEYDVYPNYTYRPAFSSRRAFRDFQLTRNVNDVVHMYLFCQFAKIWTFSTAQDTR